MYYVSNIRGGKYEITNTEDDVSKYYCLSDMELLCNRINILGWNNQGSYGSIVYNEYFDLLNCVKPYAIKHLLSGDFTVPITVKDEEEQKLVDITEVYNDFFSQRGIQKKSSVYLPDKSAKLFKSSDGDIIYKFSRYRRLIMPNTGEKDIEILEKFYYNIKNDNIYIALKPLRDTIKIDDTYLYSVLSWSCDYLFIKEVV